MFDRETVVAQAFPKAMASFAIVPSSAWPLALSRRAFGDCFGPAAATPPQGYCSLALFS